jgi:hypothetical protein
VFVLVYLGVVESVEGVFEGFGESEGREWVWTGCGWLRARGESGVSSVSSVREDGIFV